MITAMKSSANFPYNRLYCKALCWLIFGLVTAGSQISVADTYDYTEINSETFDNEYQSAFLTDRWLFQSGSEPGYAQPGLDDSEWIPVSTTLAASDRNIIDWEGEGWFRLHIDVDSTMVGVPLVFDELKRSGFVEIWLNGKSIYTGVSETGFFRRTVEPFPIFSFDQPGKQLLAVHYKNHQNSSYSEPGFRYDLVKAEHHIHTVMDRLRIAGSLQYFVAGTLLVFCLLHLLLFIYYRRHRTNLYFAIFCALLGAYLFFHYQSELLSTRRPDEFALFLKILRSLAILGFIRFAYAILSPDHFPVSRFIVYACVISVDVVLYYIDPTLTYNLLTEIIILIFLIDLGYLLIRGWQQNMEGVAIFGIGLAAFIVAQLTSMLQVYEWVGDVRDWVELSGIGILLTTMSITLSRQFAMTSLHLEQKLEEVQTLSQKAVEEERRRQQSEMNRKLLEADNQRKTKELEEARELQLSMLPECIPGTSHFSITAGMKTATEVGGDYYDYGYNPDGNMVIALGDATGHGARAGILVTAAKSAFHSGVKHYDNSRLLKEMSGAIQSLNLKGIYMNMALAECNSNTITVSQAGMPPVIHYDQSEHTTDIYKCKGMPLGTVRDFPHESVSIEMDQGDLLILMSDGLPEAINRYDFMAGYDLITRKIEELADNSTDVIRNELINLITHGNPDVHPPDDVTIVILRYGLYQQ